jgi:hypothetical protein
MEFLITGMGGLYNNHGFWIKNWKYLGVITGSLNNQVCYNRVEKQFISE